jgi:glycosyltransferase involved in cell wall biosynthesis
MAGGEETSGLSLVIAHVSDGLRTGGAEVLIRQLCHEYRARGHRVQAHALFTGGEVADALRGDGIPVYLHGPGSRWQVTRRLAAEFKRTRPDVVHCHNATATIIGAPAARWAGVPTIISTRHGLVAPPHPWRREVQFSLAARLCQYVAGVCEATTRNLALAPFAAKDRLVTVYNGAAPAPADETLPKDGFTLLWVGRLASPKDPLTLLRAMARVRAGRSDVYLWVVGDGALLAQSQEFCRSAGLERAVTFWGERRDVGTFLHSADAFVLSSASEGLPMSLLEAMAAARPVLVTEAGAMPEVVEGARCGVVSPVGGVEAMAAAMTAMADDPVQCRAWGEAGLTHYRSHFTTELMAERYLELYRSPRR